MTMLLPAAIDFQSDARKIDERRPPWMARATLYVLVAALLTAGIWTALAKVDHVDRLKEIPVHIVHGRYDGMCHLYQAEALVRALRAVGNNEVNYFITTAGHGSLSRKPTPSYARS